MDEANCTYRSFIPGSHTHLMHKAIRFIFTSFTNMHFQGDK
jgi:hypothetical protein